MSSNVLVVLLTVVCLFVGKAFHCRGGSIGIPTMTIIPNIVGASISPKKSSTNRTSHVFIVTCDLTGPLRIEPNQFAHLLHQGWREIANGVVGDEVLQMT